MKEERVCFFQSKEKILGTWIYVRRWNPKSLTTFLEDYAFPSCKMVLLYRWEAGNKQWHLDCVL